MNSGVPITPEMNVIYCLWMILFGVLTLISLFQIDQTTSCNS